MKKNKTDTLKRLLFGPLYNSDERLRSGIDKAGNYSFVFLSFCLFLGMLFGLVFDRLDISIFSMLFFLGGGIVHLFFLIRLGSIPSGMVLSDTTGKKKSKLKAFFAYLFSALLFFCIYFIFQIISNKDLSTDYIVVSLKTSLITAVLWIILFPALMSAIGFLSSRRTEKMIKEAEIE
jgi:hypothetical protein